MLTKPADDIAKRLTGHPSRPKLVLLLRGQARISTCWFGPFREIFRKIKYPAGVSQPGFKNDSFSRRSRLLERVGNATGCRINDHITIVHNRILMVSSRRHLGHEAIR